MKLPAEEIDNRARMHMATDPAASYAAAVRFVVADAEGRGERLQFAGADPASLELHHAVRKLIEEEAAKGNVLTYREAVRRVEMARSKC